MASSENTRVSRSMAPKVAPPPPPVYCICRTPDDAERPMIACEGGCEDWFHWDCVQLDETSYEDIIDYICPACEISTGLKTTRVDLLESPPEHASPDATGQPSSTGPAGDTASASKPAAKKKAAPKKKNKAVSMDDEEHVEEQDESATPSKRASTSTAKASSSKASASKPKPVPRRTSSTTQPFVAIPSTPASDPTRRTCLEGIRSTVLSLLGGDESKARAYATELEELVWVGEEGATTNGRKKYQDRMRSLRFNVSKADRTQLRSGIADGSIGPERLSKMNSNDLANPTAQALYSAASAASLALRTLPATSDSTPMVVHNHKGVIEVSDSRLEMAREEEEQRRQEELDRTKRKRDRDYDESAMGVLEKSGRAAAEEVGAVKRRRSDGAGEREEAIVPRSTEIDQPFSMKSLDDETSDERGGLDPDFAMEFNEFLTDDAIHGTTSADVYEPPLGGGSPFRDLDRGGSPFRDLGPLNGADEDEQAMFDFFVDEPKQEGDKKEADAPALGNAAESSGKGKQADSDATKADNVVTESKEVKAKRAEDELLSPSAEVVWRGEIINPEVSQPGSLRAVQIGGPVATAADFASALLPRAINTIIGRVPVEASRKFLLQMHLTPTKELVVVVLDGEGTEGVANATGLHGFLKKRGRDALVLPHDKNDLPSGGARDLYIVALSASDPLPEFLDIMDTNRLPSIRTKDYLLGVFIRAKPQPGGSSKSKAARPPPEARSTTPPFPLPTIASPYVPPPPASLLPVPTPSAPIAISPVAPAVAGLPIPAIDSSSIASILAQLSGVIPAIAASPNPSLQLPPPQQAYHAPSPHHPSSSGHSPYHPQPNLAPPPQAYRPPPPPPTTTQPYNSYSAGPPPPGPGWYSGPSPPAPPPSNGYGGGGQGGYGGPTLHQQQQHQGGYDPSRGGGGGGGDRGGGGRGGRGRGGWEAPGRGGGDQGWGRRGGRGGGS